MKSRYDVVIVGAGMVGLTAAGLLSVHDQLRITVIDSGSKPVFNAESGMSLRVSAIAPGSVDLIATLGAWDEILKGRVCPFRDMRVWDAAGHVDGPETLRFSAAEFALPQLGFIVENVLIQHALLNVLERAKVDLRFDTTIQSISRPTNRFAIKLESGEILRPDLLVGADGANSLVRKSAGVGLKSWPHDQKAFVTCLRPEHGHRNTAWQRFLREGPVGLLPLADGRVSMVWSAIPEDADLALVMSDEELTEKLTVVTDGVLGTLTPDGPRGAFPLRSQHADSYVRDGLVLIGDAAHTIHPLAGQGVNLGLADAHQLASVVSAALYVEENPGDLPVLRSYERARKGANKTMLHFMDGLNRLYSNDAAMLAQLRGIGMYIFNKSGPIRRRVIEVALGV